MEGWEGLVEVWDGMLMVMLMVIGTRIRGLWVVGFVLNGDEDLRVFALGWLSGVGSRGVGELGLGR